MTAIAKARSGIFLLAAVFSAAGLYGQTNLITNGQFASGLTGWTTSVSTAGSSSGTCSYNAVTSPGTETLTSTAGFPAATGATTNALGSVSVTATGFYSCVLYQDIAIPANAATAVISVYSGSKLLGSQASGDQALFIGLYPTSSVPNFSLPFLGSRIVASTPGTTLDPRTTASFNVSSLAGTTVRFAIINAVQTPGGGSGAPISGGVVAGITNVQFNVTLAVPTVTGLSPSSGSTAGGTSVAITGTNLTGATAVLFGSTPATSFTVNNATSITATAPAGSAGTVNVTVTTPSGTSATGAANQFTYVTPVPTVTGLSPATDSTAGGASVAITGTNFTGATAVLFGSTPATSFTVNNATSITATAPAGSAGTVNVTVTTPAGTSATGAANQFTYTTPAPTVTGLSPASSTTAGGVSVAITGTNFTGATAVAFGSTPATSFTVNNATSITATAPAGSAGSVNVTVTTPAGTSAAGSGNLFTYTIPAPTITGLNPTSGPAGGTITITGTNLTGAASVQFGSTAAASFTVVNATTITAVVPSGVSGTVNVSVTTPGGTTSSSSASQFTVTQAAVAVPTLGEWAMIALALMLAGVGYLWLRRFAPRGAA